MDIKQEKYLDAALSTHLFDNISKVEAASVIRTLEGEIINYSKGQTVAEYKDGEQPQHIMLILSGMIQMVRFGLHGERYLLDYSFSGSVAGYIASMSKRFIYGSSLVAGRDTTVLKLHISSVKDLDVKNKTAFEENLLKLISDKYARLLQKGDITTRRFVQDKILTYLQYERQLQGASVFEIPLNRQELADYICVDRTTLSTELTKMKKAGVIKTRKYHFELLTQNSSAI